MSNGTFDQDATRQALMITEQLQGDAHARDLWQRLYDPTVFYVGHADDLSFYDYATLSAQRIRLADRSSASPMPPSSSTFHDPGGQGAGASRHRKPNGAGAQGSNFASWASASSPTRACYRN